MKQLIVATRNVHKLREIGAMLSGRYRVLGLDDIGCSDDIPEDGDTFEANAVAKALWVRSRYGVDCIADDSGLEVDALGGAPGVHSARYAGTAHDDAANNARLLRELQGVADRSARFRTVLALVRGDSDPLFFSGSIEGSILETPRGDGGFGYDPLFRPDGWNCTFAEGTPEAKNAVSHRRRALDKLVEFLDTENRQ
ncbi:MAG: RdgB/HAM1 family non-canonical purine NTP pyrophosphatase [Muribaculaceae bacterium]|nr:RdgB/HAM1 family non-canonical purine NTP pyrophosphatase [Muribaculaceae bacterium]